ncbi:MAG: hypothetical protein IT169_16065 [Bryobacterales bacterium]|nr:hypothetical protein [Bryobacterales bacterium]
MISNRLWIAFLLLLAGWPGLAQDPAAELHRQFQNPPRQYSIAPYWFWNGTITSEESRRQLQAMMAQGVFEATILPWDGMSPRYLSEEFWQQIGAALDIAEELGFTLNLLDDYNWPSGHLWDFGSGQPELSRVLQQGPQYRMRRLAHKEHPVDGGQTWTAAPGEAVEIAVAGRLEADGSLEAGSLRVLEAAQRSSWTAPEGRWLVTTYWTEPAVAGHNTRVDLLNPDAVALYIDLFYGEIERRFSRHFGKTLKLTIADHEGAYGSQIAWTPALWNEFQARKGYDARTRLPLLSRQSSDPTAAQQFRIDYLDVISALYAESFSKQVNDWCARHGLKHGTSIYEEQLYIQVNGAGDMFQHWRNSSFVMVDALLERGRMPMDFREPASVADLEGTPLWVENQGLQGHSTYFSLEKARYGTNAILLWGANKLCPYFLYDPVKTTWPPQWFLGQPLWPWFHNYADYARRALFMNGSGRRVSRVAVYYPLETAFASTEILFTNEPHRDLVWGNAMDQTQNVYTALVLELEKRRLETHVLDRHYLKQAAVNGKVLRLAGQEFSVLLLPPLTQIDEGAAARIREFALAGGKVIATGTLPPSLESVEGIQAFALPTRAKFMDRLDYMNPTLVPKEIQTDLAPVMDAVVRALPPQPSIVEGESPAIRWSHRSAPGLEWYWVVNDSANRHEIRLRMPKLAAFERWDPETGARRRLVARDGVLDLEFEPWEAFYLVLSTQSSADATPLLVERRSIPIPQEGWRFEPEDEVRVPYAFQEGGSALWLSPERLSARSWWLIGPFAYEDHHGFYKPYPPEREFDPERVYAGAYGDVRWQWCESPTYSVTFRDLLRTPRGQELGVYYAFAYVHSPEDRDIQTLAAFADGLKIWVNGEKVMEEHRHPKWLEMRDIWAERRPAKLRKGWNRVLLKIEPSLMVPTAFLFRLTGADGDTLRDLAWARYPESPAAVNGQTLRLRVDVPPAASAFDMPVFSRPAKVSVDGRIRPAAAPGAWVALRPGAKSVEFVIDAADAPDRPIRFRTRPVTVSLFRWTNTALAHYSGRGMYEREISVPPLGGGERVMLDLGEVGLAAELWVNGKPAGQRAWRPYRFDITEWVNAGRNRIRIRVANSDAGWQSQGDTVYPKGSWGLKYQTERDRLPTLVPNGLEGPAQLTILRPEAP